MGWDGGSLALMYLPPSLLVSLLQLAPEDFGSHPLVSSPVLMRVLFLFVSLLPS